MKAPAPVTTALEASPSIPAWVWVLLVVVVLLAIAVLVFWLRKRRGSQGAPARASLASEFRTFLRTRDASERGAPLFVVVGHEPDAPAALLRALLPGTAPDTAGPASFTATGGALIATLSPAFVADPAPATVAELQALFHEVPSGVIVLLVALDARSTRSSQSVSALGEQLRTLLRLANARSSRVGLRLCLLHADELPGFEPCTALARDSTAPVELDSLATPEHELTRWDAELPRALVEYDELRFDASVRFVGALSELFSTLAPLAHVSDGVVPVRELSGVYLVGASVTAALADPLGMPPAELARSTAAMRQRHRRRAVTLAAGASAALFVAFAGHWYWLRSVEERVAAFLRGVESGARTDLDARAERAGAAVRELDYWCLPWVFVWRRAAASLDFSEAVRRAYLAPGLAQAESDPTAFFYAASLAHATRDNALGAEIGAASAWWAARLSMPDTAVRDYIALREEDAWPATLLEKDTAGSPPAFGDWSELLGALERVQLEGSLGSVALAAFDESPAFRWLTPGAEELAAVQRVARELARSNDPTEARVAGALAADLDFVEQNRAGLVQIQRVVSGASGGAPAATPSTLAELLTALKAAFPATPATAAPLPLRTSLRSFQIIPARLEAAFATSRASDSFSRFVDARRSATLPAFFARDTSFPAPPAPAPGPGPTRTLPALYTKQSFQQSVQPVLKDLAPTLAALPLAPALESRVTALVTDETRAYAEGYRRALDAYFTSVRFEPASASELPGMLADLGAPGSWFESFVKTVADNADLALDGLDAGALESALLPYRSIVTVASGKGLADYAAIVLAAVTPPATPPDPAAGLAARLSPLGRSTLPPSNPDSPSPRTSVNAWLRKWLIPSRYQAPFLVPIAHLEAAGQAEVNRVIAETWERDIAVGLRALLVQYPFESFADPERGVTTLALEAELGPKGRFFSQFQSLIAPLTQTTPKGRAMRAPFRAPEGMLPLVDAAEAFQRRLWQEDGSRRALSFGVTSVELPKVEPDAPLVTQAQLSFGSERAYAFNQARSERRLQVSWWSTGTSRVLVEITDPQAERTERLQTLAAATGPYSFLRLLSQGTRRDDVYGFPVRIGARTYAIEFEFSEDPWSAFEALAQGAK